MKLKFEHMLVGSGMAITTIGITALLGWPIALSILGIWLFVFGMRVWEEKR